MDHRWLILIDLRARLEHVAIEAAAGDARHRMIVMVAGDNDANVEVPRTARTS